MKSLLFLLFVVAMSLEATSQNTKNQLPFHQIPDYPDSFTAATVTARMIDGLGFRYYWATEGLTAEDLAFKPSKEARTCEETIDHILGLSRGIHRTILPDADRPQSSSELNFIEKRQMTLELLQETRSFLISNPQVDLSKFVISPGRGDYPFWHLINGQIADAIWHVGQVVSFRRSSGNPFNSNVSVFEGKVR